MKWQRIRDHYKHLFKIADRTQDEVAQAADLSGQNAISRLLANENMGPSVETFVKAIRGLGITPSQFFATLEQADMAPPSPADIRAGGLHVSSSPAQGPASGGHPGRNNIINITQGDERLEHLVRTGFDELKRALERLAADRDAHGIPDPQKTATRARARRRPRKTA